MYTIDQDLVDVFDEVLGPDWESEVGATAPAPPDIWQLIDDWLDKKNIDFLEWLNKTFPKGTRGDFPEPPSDPGYA